MFALFQANEWRDRHESWRDGRSANEVYRRSLSRRLAQFLRCYSPFKNCTIFKSRFPDERVIRSAGKCEEREINIRNTSNINFRAIRRRTEELEQLQDNRIVR